MAYPPSSSSSSSPSPKRPHPDDVRPMHPSVPQTIRVVTRPGGLFAFLSTLFAIILLIGVFFTGIFFGVLAMIGSAAERPIVETTFRDGARAQRIAIIPVESFIDARAAGFVRHAVDSVLEDDTIKAVILRVESPGGTVAGSDQIWHELQRVQRSGRPVVASFGGVAASGGYYIAAAADHIVAEETTITGSIGVIAQLFTFNELMDKIGVQPVTIVATSSPQKDTANDIFREWGEQDRRVVRRLLDAAHETFISRVQTGRSSVLTNTEALDDVVDGSIFTAREALGNGLIDSIGYIDQAIVEAERLAKLTVRAKVVRIESPRTLLSGLLAESSRSSSSADLLDADRLRSLFNEAASPRVLYLLH